MKTTTHKIQLTLINPILGSLPANKEIMQDFIASKAPTTSQADEELVCVAEAVEKGTTVFAHDEKGCFLWDYQVKGFLKEAIGVLTELGDLKLSKWTYKRVVDSTLFITPRKLYIKSADGTTYTKADSFMERPLRAETMQGDRVALARSEEIDAGALITFDLRILESSNTKSKFAAISFDAVRQALDYGMLKGLGQWRNAGYGAFTWEEAK